MDGPRVARPEELPAIIELAEHVFADLENRPRFLARMFPRFLSAANIDNLYVVAQGGRPVAFLGTDLQTLITRGCRIPCGMIGGVCTHEEHRGHGYSGLLAQLAYRRLRDTGAALVWISGRRSVYLTSGAAPVWPLLRAEAAREQLQPPADAAPEIVRAAPVDLSELVALHDREPVRFAWRPEWLAAVPPRLMEPDLGGTYFIRRRGQTVAAACMRWAVLRGNQYTTRQQPGESVELLDWFGERRAVAEVLPAILAELGAAKVFCRLTAYDAELLAALRAANFKIEPIAPCYWTLKVLDFARLLECLRPHLERSLGRQAEALRATQKGLEVRVEATAPAAAIEYATPDEQTAARLLFSLPEDWADPDKIGTMPPEVRRFLARAFPVPLRHYGLNYI